MLNVLKNSLYQLSMCHDLKQTAFNFEVISRCYRLMLVYFVTLKSIL